MATYLTRSDINDSSHSNKSAYNSRDPFRWLPQTSTNQNNSATGEYPTTGNSNGTNYADITGKSLSTYNSLRGLRGVNELSNPSVNPNGDSGSGGGNGSGSGYESLAPGVSASGSSSVSWGSGGSAGGTATLPGSNNTSAQPYGVDAVQEKLRAATDLANQGALDIYNSGKAELNANVENQLRELYIARMMADRALPIQMSAQGINGGATETTLAGNRNQYQSNRNALYQDSNAKLAELLKTYNTSVNQNEQDLAQQMADLRMQLAIMEAQAKYDKELARLRS